MVVKYLLMNILICLIKVKNHNFMNKLNLKKGFTLIELLVVVSIISIISSIVVAVLVDAKIGAKNNRKNELVAQYITALSLYYGEYGEYPEGGCTDCAEPTYVCLGDDYISDRCFIFGIEPEDYHNENSTVNTQISEFIPGLPSSLDESIHGGKTFVGITYGCTDENCNQYEVSWVLEGEGNDASCYGGASETPFGPIKICTFATQR